MVLAKNFFKRSWQVVISSAKNFITDDCYTKASTLTFYTIQSIVPFLALVFGIAKGFGFESYLKAASADLLQNQEEVINYATQFALQTLQNIKGGIIVGFGVLFLIWTTLNLLGYIEEAFNDIWKIDTPRLPFRMFTDYISFVILCPLFVVISSSLTIFIKAQIAQLNGNMIANMLGDALLVTFNIAPWVLSWIIFFMLYYFMPNSKSRVWPKVIAAIFAGSLFQIWQILYIILQVRVFSYNAIYGAFAALPLFFIWVQFSWLIALAGAEIAAHIENDFFINLKGRGEKITNRQLALIILFYCLKPFYQGQQAPTDREISAYLKSKLDVTQKMLRILSNGNILIQNGINGGYKPYNDPHCFTIKQVCDVIDRSFDFEILVESSTELDHVLEKLSKFERAKEKSEANLRLDQIIH